MSAILPALVNGFILSVPLAAAVWLALRLGRRSLNAATRYGVWWIALAATVAVPLFFLPSGFSGRRAQQANDSRVPHTPSLRVGSLEGPFASVRNAQGADAIAQPALPAPDSPSAPTADAAVARVKDVILSAAKNLSAGFAAAKARFLSVAPLRLPSGAWPARILELWALVSLLMFARLAASFALLHSQKKSAAEVPPALRKTMERCLAVCALRGRASREGAFQEVVSRQVRIAIVKSGDSPMVAGPLRPCVLIPARLLSALDDAEMEQICLHEAAHLARYDDWSLLLQRTIEALFVFHPVVRWIARQIDLEREIACDDFVISATGEPRPYASCLTHVAELAVGYSSSPVAAAVVDESSHLTRRITMLLDKSRPTETRILKLRLALALLALGLFTWFAGKSPALFALAPQQAQTTQQRLVVNIDRSQRIYLGNEPVNIQDLGSKVRAQMQSPQSDAVYLHWDETVPYAFIIEVVDTLRQSGIGYIGLVTQPSAPPVQPPAAQQAQTTQQRLVVNIDRSQRIYLGDEPVNIQDLGSKVRAQMPEAVYLHWDETVPFALIAEVVDTLRQSGIDHIGLVTQPPAPPSQLPAAQSSPEKNQFKTVQTAASQDQRTQDIDDALQKLDQVQRQMDQLARNSLQSSSALAQGSTSSLSQPDQASPTPPGVQQALDRLRQAQQDMERATSQQQKAQEAARNAADQLREATNALQAQQPQIQPSSRAPINLKMTNDSKTVFETVAKLAGLTVIFDPNFTSRSITVDVVNVTVEQALDAISLQAKAFWKPATNTVIFVAPTTQIGGNGAVEMLTPTQGVNFDSYLQHVVGSVKSNWSNAMPESVYRGDKGRVVVQFRILRDGTVQEPQVISTSQKDALDRASLSTVQASSPFESLPAAFSGPYIELRFTFFYNIEPNDQPQEPAGNGAQSNPGPGSAQGNAQQPTPSLVGNWHGNFNRNGTDELIDIGLSKSTTAEYSYTLNIVPATGNSGLTIALPNPLPATVKGNALHLEFRNPNGLIAFSYDGTLSTNGQEIAGEIAVPKQVNWPAPAEQGAPQPLTVEREADIPAGYPRKPPLANR